MIGDDVVVTIVDIRGDKVRLGINAPQDIPVHRQEVYEAIKRENQTALQLDTSQTRQLGKKSGEGSGGKETGQTNGLEKKTKGAGGGSELGNTKEYRDSKIDNYNVHPYFVEVNCRGSYARLNQLLG